MKLRSVPKGRFYGAALVAMGLAICAPVVASNTSADSAPAGRGLADNQLAPMSQTQLSIGENLMAKGELNAAIDHFEAALVADPRNRRAYVGLARVAEAQGLPGKAVRFYREALELEPNDLDILELQGKALLMRGARASATANLERLKKLCAAPCPQSDRLAATLNEPPKVASATPANDGVDATEPPPVAPASPPAPAPEATEP